MRIRFVVRLLCFLAAAVPAAAAPPRAAGLHIKLLRSDTVLAADGSFVATLHAERAADSVASAMALGQTSIPYVTAYQTLEVLEAYTRKADGKKIPVDVGAIYDQLPPAAPGMPAITDVHVKTIVFPQFAAGDTAVYTARVTTKNGIFPGQYWGGVAFPAELAFDDVQETLTAPANLALHVENHGVKFDKSLKDGHAVYRWRYSAPASGPTEPSVFPLAHVPHFFISTFPDYAALGRAYADAAAPETAVTPSIKALADSVTKGARDRREEVRVLYEWVAGHIRYVAIELGKGTLVPHAADVVLSNGYGDCKDHVALFEALLKAKGIASEPVLLNATNVYELSEVPTYTGLDHVITFVPELNLYLDSTPAVAPFGVLPISEYGKPAVYASGTAPRLGAIPVLPPGLASATTKTVAHLGKDGVLSATTTTKATGPYAILLRAVGLGIQALGPEAAAKQILERSGHGSSAAGTLEASPPTELSDSYSVTGSFTENDWSEQVAGTDDFYLPGGMRLLGVSGDGLMGPFNNGPKPDVEIPCYSGQASEDLSLVAPPGKRFSSVPPDTHVNTANIRFDAHWTLADGTMSVHRSFTSTIDQALCTAAIRAANADALKTISKSYDVRLSFPAADNSPQQRWYAADIATPPKDPKLAAMLEDGLASMQHHQDDTAITQFSAILALPDVPISASYPSRYNLAVLYARHRQYDMALTTLDAALSQTPGDQRMLLTRAQLNFQRGDFANALADCDADLSGHSADAFALYLRANIEMEGGKNQDAIRDYTGAMQTVRERNALVLRAVAYHRMGRESDAAADIAEASQLDDAAAKPDYDAIVQAPPNVKAPETHRDTTDAIRRSNAPGLSAPTAANSHTWYFPPLSKRLGESGQTRIGFVVGVDGNVSDPDIESSSGFPALDQAALDAVRNWRYHPALEAGKPVAVRHSANVRWNLD